MSQPLDYGGPVGAPPPGQIAPERLIARFRRRSTSWPLQALVLIAVCGAVGFFSGNLPAPWEDWMLWAAASVIALLFVVAPRLRWLTSNYAITTRRVVVHEGFLGVKRREYLHIRGYSASIVRSPWERLTGAGTIVLQNGAEPALRLAHVADPALVHEVLVDQIEVNQILAHRDAQVRGE